MAEKKIDHRRHKTWLELPAPVREALDFAFAHRWRVGPIPLPWAELQQAFRPIFNAANFLDEAKQKPIIDAVRTFSLLATC